MVDFFFALIDLYIFDHVSILIKCEVNKEISVHRVQTRENQNYMIYQKHSLGADVHFTFLVTREQ